MKYAIGLTLTLLMLPAWASASVTAVPEPGILPLMAIGMVGGLVIWARNRNKK